MLSGKDSHFEIHCLNAFLVGWGFPKRILFLLKNSEQQRQKEYIREGPEMEKKKLKKNGRCLLILLLHLDPPYLLYLGRWKKPLISDSSACLCYCYLNTLLGSLLDYTFLKVKDWVLGGFYLLRCLSQGSVKEHSAS